MIYILTGDVHIGKTTALAHWIKDKKDVGGFLSPDINEKRYLRNLETNKHIEFQVDEKYSGNTIEVGPYLFSEQAFKTASQWALEHLKNEVIQWIIIDEIGKLELKKEGFYNLVNSLLQNDVNKNYLFVIRKNLLQELIELLSIKEFKLVNLDQIETLN